MNVGDTWAQDTIDDLMAEHYPGSEQGLVLVNLVTPGQVITEHTDHEKFRCRRRVHVPLTSDPACFFVTGGREHHMAVGSAYEIDLSAPHGVVHRGTRRRIHLMFNVGDDDGC